MTTITNWDGKEIRVCDFTDCVKTTVRKHRNKKDYCKKHFELMKV